VHGRRRPRRAEDIPDIDRHTNRPLYDDSYHSNARCTCVALYLGYRSTGSKKDIDINACCEKKVVS